MKQPKIAKQKLKNERRYGCPYCDFRGTKLELVNHIDETHEHLLPKDHTPARVVFNLANKKTEGTCTVCKKSSGWNEQAWRYNRICSKRCSDIYKYEVIGRRMIDKYGKTHLLDDPEVQVKMMKGREISGEYRFRDGGVRSYVGSYEKQLLEFFDRVLEAHSKNIYTPGPIFEYEYKGKKHTFISDLYYEPFNLVFDVKPGGANKNTHPNMADYNAKQTEKENAVIADGKYNYIRLTDNDFSQLMTVMLDIKNTMISDPDVRVHHINEAMIGSTQSASLSPAVYVMTYSGNEVGIEGIGVVKDLMMDTIFVHDAETMKLGIVGSDHFSDKFYSLYEVTGPDLKARYLQMVKTAHDGIEIDDINYLGKLFGESDLTTIEESVSLSGWEHVCSGYDLTSRQLTDTLSRICSVNEVASTVPVKATKWSQYKDMVIAENYLGYVVKNPKMGTALQEGKELDPLETRLYIRGY